MDYYGLLFLYYLKGLSGKSILRLFFNIEVGGTEQLLPENTSTPTTTPILADIQYPDGLRTDQYFTYRETPTIVSNKARIKTIKGNTLVWNQLLPSLAPTKEWNGINITNNDDGSLTFDGTYTGSSTGNLYVNPTSMSILSTHWYLYDFSNSALNGFAIRISSAVGTGTLQGHGATINHPNADTNDRLVLRIPVGTTFSNVKVYPQIYDLTLMFGAEKALEMRNMEVAQAESGVDYFRSLFPSPYYAYNQGTLLSFMGNGIKTVGFNQWDEEWESGRINTDGTKATSSTYIRSKNYIHIFPNTTYYRKSPNNIQPFYYDGNMNFISYGLWGANSTFVTPNNAEYMLFHIDPAYGTTYNNDICINISSSRNGEYEPYTESTISIPLDEFPNGMDGINDVHDEKNETEYVKRFATIKVNTVASGSLRNNGDYYAAVNGVTNAKPADNGTVANMICNICETMSAGARYTSTKDAVCARTTGSIELCISGITSRAGLQAYVDSHDIYITYELATPLENYGVVDLGALDWEWQDAPQNWTTLGLADVIKIPSSTFDTANILCAIYTTNSNENVYARANNKTIAVASQTGRVRIYDSQYNSASDFKSAISGIYLLYEKENPQGFTTATLVTENAEIPLSNEDGVLIGKCTEQLSSESGFFDAKIKLADEDGECYSNKIQLHVERKPS